jgi:3'-phosphoadenosine 5'-phosphosulfate (PAPS) 3'-phosphatase
LCVWIDPIDCTKGFIDGHLEYVTVLIGLSRKLTAYAGVVGTPFKNIK